MTPAEWIPVAGCFVILGIVLLYLWRWSGWVARKLGITGFFWFFGGD